jgi:phosphoesterase RecJ-like protein
MSIDWQAFAATVHAAQRILLTAHVRPDGDCIGSEIAVQWILKSLGKDVRIVNPQRTPPNLAFLDPTSTIRCLADCTEEDSAWIDGIDLLFVLDTRSWTQLGEMGELLKTTKAKKIVLDHHLKGDDIGAKDYVDSTAEATGALVVQAARTLGVPLSKEIAVPAFAALTTDTGWFRFSSVTPQTFRIAAELAEAGAEPAALYRELYEQESLGRIRLIGRILAKTESSLNGFVMCTWVMLDDLKQTGALPSDTEDVVNMLLQVNGSKIALLFSELKDNCFKVSFRSRCAVDCSRVAALFGGGGHKQAAGATLKMPFEAAKQAVLEAVHAAYRETDT